MGAKRKDSKRRNLRTGESQRKDGRYSYRYKMPGESHYHYIYARTLEELRKREEKIEADLRDGINYIDSNMTVSNLLKRYMSIVSGRFKTNTLRAYNTAIRRINKSPFSQRYISDIRVSDAKKFFVDLHHQNLKYNTIDVMRCILSPAFQMAEEDDIIRKNPFRFKLSSVIPTDAASRTALTEKQKNFLLDKDIEYTRAIPIRNGANERGQWYHDEIIILLGTGMRVSELYGLTLNDVDFKEHCIRVNKQLIRTADYLYKVETPKSESGIRTIPMSDSVYQAFRDVMEKRTPPDVERMIDGYTGFVFLTPRGLPRVAAYLQAHMSYLHKYIKKHYDPTFPSISPHVLRHTFCTDMQRSLDVKVLQYVMGHSSVDITLNTYTHMSYENVKKAFNEAMGIG